MKKRVYSCLMFAFVVGFACQSAQLTNSVSITTNLTFSLTTMGHVKPQSRFKSSDHIIYGLLGTSTNYIGYRHLPDGNFDIRLFDKNGEEILKTKSGMVFAAVPRTPTVDELRFTRKYFPYLVNEKGGEFHALLHPDEMFKITNSGIYEMEVRIRLCLIMTNGMPDLKAMTDWRNTTSRGYPFAKDFGILTSPPLRVQVIKE